VVNSNAEGRRQKTEGEGEESVFQGAGAVEAPRVPDDGLGEIDLENAFGSRASRMPSHCFWKGCWSSRVWTMIWAVFAFIVRPGRSHYPYP
jgi:hypothetical protein